MHGGCWQIPPLLANQGARTRVAARKTNRSCYGSKLILWREIGKNTNDCLARCCPVLPAFQRWRRCDRDKRRFRQNLPVFLNLHEGQVRYYRHEKNTDAFSAEAIR